MIKYELELHNNEKVNIDIFKKQIKNYYLKISSDCNIKLSIPLNSDIIDAYQFINNKKLWINKHIQKFKIYNSANIRDNICIGGSARILGRQYKIYIYKSAKNYISIEDLNINIHSKKNQDLNYVEKQYETYIKERAIIYFQTIIDNYYPIIYKYKISKPIMNIKKMRRKWGSCIPAKNKIILNLHLFKTSVGCIEYVVLHELVHLIYSGHNKDFYNFLEIQMPHWRLFKKRLDSEYTNIIY